VILTEQIKWNNVLEHIEGIFLINSVPQFCLFLKRSFSEHSRLDFAMPRMNILNKSEQEMFDSPPVFNSSERKQFFDFPSSLLEMALRLQKPASRIGFLLACGYFRAAKRFFKPQDFHQHDIEYVARWIGLSS
jgi:hypothetical protein